MPPEHDADRTEGATLRLVFDGGPWDGDTGRYFGVVDYPDVVASGGRYRFAGADARGDLVYAFRYDGSAPDAADR